jgi:hypothetical protein
MKGLCSAITMPEEGESGRVISVAKEKSRYLDLTPLSMTLIVVHLCITRIALHFLSIPQLFGTLHQTVGP